MDLKTIDFDEAPFLVIWETTQACAFACRHCRASAQPAPHPHELTTKEAKRLIQQISEMGTPLLVLSGGDPVNRPDLLELIRFAKEQGLRTATIPAASEALTRDLVSKLQDAGLDQIAFSLDFPRAQLHDAFRGADGAFDRTLRGVSWARDVGLPPQINTTVCGPTAPYLEEMAAFVAGLGIVFWEVFFLVPVGRGRLLDGLSPHQCEKLFDTIYRTQQKSSFVVKVTEAPHYRRHVAQRDTTSCKPDPSCPAGAVRMPSVLTRSEGPAGTMGLAPRGVNAGNGFLFVSHLGEIYPSGFLPLSAGNVRTSSLAEIYRTSPLFRDLRAPWRFKGRCGRCEYRGICGGSRSRAFSLTGDPLETDPWCSYKPMNRTLVSFATKRGSP